ncbi:MAG: YqiJ family protein [Myxococcota bacterium]
MWDFLSAPGNQVFNIALLVMLGIAVLEGVATLLWGGVSQVIDAMLPEADLDVDLDLDLDVDVDLDADPSGGPSGLAAAEAGLFTPILAWLQIGRVPILVLLVIFLTAFGLSGLLVQSFARELSGHALPALLASAPALAVALPSVRIFGGWVARIMPKEETSAVSRETFVGRVATIVIGTARQQTPAEARLRDEHGRTHYVMVEPDVPGEEFGQGDEVLLVRSDGARFRVIRPPSDALLVNKGEPR